MVNKSDVVAIKFHFNKSILKSNAWSPVPSSIAGERNYINIWGCFWLNSITWSTDIQPAVWVEPHTRYTVQDFSCLFSGYQTSLSLSIAKKGSVPSVNGFSSAGVIQCPKARQSHSNSWVTGFSCIHLFTQTKTDTLHIFYQTCLCWPVYNHLHVCARSGTITATR